MPQKKKIVIVGLGMSGLCMAMQLLRHGIRDFIILEKTSSCGGTWAQNTYPGVECDIESHLYSFSFEPYDWARVFSRGSDIQFYLEKCFAKYGLQEYTFFDQQVFRMEWNESLQTWYVRSTTSEWETDHVILSMAPLSIPHLTIPGIENFKGPVMHTSMWNPIALQRKRVGIIGSAASAIQCIPPVVREAEQVTIFQRTPNWILPKRNRSYSKVERWCLRHTCFRILYRLFLYTYHEVLFFGFFKGSRFGTFLQSRSQTFIQQSVSCPRVQNKLTPSYPLGCKRVLFSDEYLNVFNQPHVKLVTESIHAFESHRVVTNDQKVHECDVILLATGFEILGSVSRITVVGQHGKKLMDHLDSSYFGVVIHDFPGLFLLLGPNSGSAHNSIIYYVEAQVEYILQQIIQGRPHNIPTPSRLSQKMNQFVWSQCSNWYQDNVLFPGFSFEYRRRLLA